MTGNKTPKTVSLNYTKVQQENIVQASFEKTTFIHEYLFYIFGLKVKKKILEIHTKNPAILK